MARLTKAERAERKTHAEELLLRWLDNGTVVYSIRRTPKSHDYYCIIGSRLQFLSGIIANYTGYTQTRDGAIRDDGDPYPLIYEVSRALFGDGYALNHDRI